MKNSLEVLRTSALTNMEGGQLIKRHLNDLRTLDPTLLTDAPFHEYVKRLTGQAETYEKALAQVRTNEETEKISQADDLRDKAVAAFAAALKLYAKSDDPAEAEASRGLRILLNNFGDLVRLNYEAETIGIDKLVGELNGPNYTARKYYADLLARRTAVPQPVTPSPVI